MDKRNIYPQLKCSECQILTLECMTNGDEVAALVDDLALCPNFGRPNCSVVDAQRYDDEPARGACANSAESFDSTYFQNERKKRMKTVMDRLNRRSVGGTATEIDPVIITNLFD